MPRNRNQRNPRGGGPALAFAPAFARPFAPAFASSTRAAPQDDSDEDDYEYMQRAETRIGKTWNTYDPEQKSVVWTGSSGSAEQRQDDGLRRGAWNMWGHAKLGEPVGEQRELRDLFFKDEEIMRHDAAPRNDFESRNQSALGLGRKSSGIVNEIGGKVVSYFDDAGDDRLGLMDREGNYVDGIWRGRPKKRLLDERARRFQQKDEEIEHACAVMEEWESLSDWEREVRIERARKNKVTMLELLGISEVEEMPEDYLHEVPSLPIEEEESLFVRSPGSQSPSIVLDEERPPRRPRLSESAQAREREAPNQRRSQELQDRGDGARREGLYDRATPTSGALQRRKRDRALREAQQQSITSQHDERDRERDQALRAAELSSIARSATASTASTPRALSIASEVPFSATPTRSGSILSSTASTADESIATEQSAFGVSKWPRPVPFEDLDKAPLSKEDLDEAQNSLYAALSRSCTKKPRLVVVELSSDIPTFSSEAVVSRIFAGLVQEIQFYPEERVALVLFVKPADAIAFLTHVQYARRTSAHEYRRLQVAVDWHQGKKRDSTVTQARYVSRLALFMHGTRVLRIDSIDKRIQREDLLAVLKLRLNKYGLIVQCKLVRPKHRYEQEAQYSNEVVLEFASITQAANVKARFDAQKVKEFERSTATYLADPICAPKVRLPGCPCAHCAPPPRSAPPTASRISTDAESSVAGGVESLAGSEASKNLRRAALIDEARRRTREEGVSYDYEADARAVDEWEDRRPWERRTHHF